jgi:flagellar export protein FliJ
MAWHGKRAEAEKRELERLFGVQAEIRSAIHSLESESRELSSRLELASAVPASDLAHAAEYSRHLQRRKDQLHVDKTQCDDSIGAQRQRCIEADRQYKLLSKYKDRQFGEWRREFDRELNQLAAESHLSRWARELSSSSS